MYNTAEIQIFLNFHQPCDVYCDKAIYQPGYLCKVCFKKYHWMKLPRPEYEGTKKCSLCG